MLDEAVPCFVTIAREVLKREKLIVVCADAATVRSQLGPVDNQRLVLAELPTNDTWARDHGGLSVFADGRPLLCEFTFNGWGLKFPANLDNQITRGLYQKGVFNQQVLLKSFKPFVLEGGSLETDGKGTLLTTAQCLLSANRNDITDEAVLEQSLKSFFGLKRVLWLHHGKLVGDDTDSHIDTLARFCDAETIAYVAPGNPEDEQYEALALMEKELRTFRTLQGKSYRLIALPVADPVFHEGSRLPATYANFLIFNGAVLAPVYDAPKDELAIKALQQVFPDREIIPINCLPLIRQNGSLHCLTMQYPEGFVD